MNFLKSAGQTEALKLDVHEAYTLWRAYTDRNASIHHLSMLKYYIHDADFNVYLTKILRDLKKESNTLEQLLQKYSIAGPEPAVDKHKAAGNAQLELDQEVAQVLNRFIRLDVNLMAFSLKFTPTNDDIWSFMVELAKSAINRIDNLVIYMKLKNWLYMPPLYPHVPPDNHEQVAINSITVLWDQLVYRYHNLRQTQFFSTFASDADLIILLKTGIGILQKQIKALEDKMVYYGVSLPKHYPNVTVNIKDKSIIDDKFILNIIRVGMRDALALHASSIQEIIVNDKLRKFFIDMTLSEIDYLSKFTIYGKVKGWVFPTPVLLGVK
ncbi:hypothetical protein SPSYN_01409 [Sporotomaculum syntrophicum]|uniref:DUF3231 family protein n=1 Tax=Sporotomaculum syntrophicum TaxID=182264 RepID=A0A9D3AYY9_9FIRM|nr:DUF3231 family protein [Sporotomaculum syntrophicum]KAF1085273.1 hypothetical protein SPSYN_01409 [Sporotomaculum syntrophicum]